VGLEHLANDANLSLEDLEVGLELFLHEQLVSTVLKTHHDLEGQPLEYHELGSKVGRVFVNGNLQIESGSLGVGIQLVHVQTLVKAVLQSLVVLDVPEFFLGLQLACKPATLTQNEEALSAPKQFRQKSRALLTVLLFQDVQGQLATRLALGVAGAV